VSALQKKDDTDFDTQGFWDHAIYTGAIARRLARDLGYRVTGEVFVGGLLHDMGISILHQHFTSEYAKIVKLVAETEMTWLEAEKNVLGVSHGEMGGWLAERWNFPNTLVEAITKHHSPLEAKENPELVSIIHCADVLANRLCATPVVYDTRLTFQPDVLQRLRLDDPMVLDEYMNRYEKNIQADMAQFEGMLRGGRD
jgi:putative nucleotidyltransferase with HDIG domain